MSGRERRSAMKGLSVFLKDLIHEGQTLDIPKA